MGERPRVLFLLFEGLPGTVVDSQVLANVRSLQSAGVAEFEVWTFACVGALWRSSRERLTAAATLAKAPIRLYRGLRPLSPLAYLVNVLIFAWRLFPHRRRFTHIHARTDYSAAVAGPVARLYRIELIWDCRGDAVAEVEERFVDRPTWLASLVWLRAHEFRCYARLAGGLCSGAIFVTDELHALHRDLVGAKPIEVIPCVADEKMFFFDPELRAATRRELGIAEDETVLVYSGSLNEYQCFRDTVALFARAHARDRRIRLLVLTPAVKEARVQLQCLAAGSYQIRACTLDEVPAYLNASDVGMLLRQPRRTNRVASPTKFAEYALTGLAVLVGEAVPYAFRLAERLGIRVSIRDGIPVLPRVDRAVAAARAREALARSGFHGGYRRLYGGAAART